MIDRIFRRRINQICFVIFACLMVFPVFLTFHFLQPDNMLLHQVFALTLQQFVAAIVLIFPFGLAQDVFVHKEPFQQAILVYFTPARGEKVQAWRVVTVVLGIPLLLILSYQGIGLRWHHFRLPFVILAAFLLKRVWKRRP